MALSEDLKLTSCLEVEAASVPSMLLLYAVFSQNAASDNEYPIHYDIKYAAH